jgi:hypothetical protein
VAACLVALSAAPSWAQSPPDTLHFSVQAQIIVTDAEAAGRSLSDWAEREGGYFTKRSLERVDLRIPSPTFPALRGRLEQTAEEVVSYAPSANDLREQLAAVEAALTSRNESLNLVLSYLDDADVAGTLALEREIQSLVQSIEQLEGRKRQLLNDAAYATVAVLFSSPAQTIPSQMPSTFAWLNGVDLYLLLERVR